MLKAALAFRSEHHKDWFFSTVVLFAVGIGAATQGISFLAWMWMWGHLLTSLAAVYAIGLRKMRTHEYLSIDCIWYNGLMALLNGLVIVATKLLPLS